MLAFLFLPRSDVRVESNNLLGRSLSAPTPLQDDFIGLFERVTSKERSISICALSDFARRVPDADKSNDREAGFP